MLTIGILYQHYSNLSYIFPLAISFSKFMPKLPGSKIKKGDIILRSKICLPAGENDICPDSMKFTVRT